jgi:tRNA threonylcarbamoyladenosine biosynthesis protein TsaE
MIYETGTETVCRMASNGITFISHGPEETYSFGKRLGEKLQRGDVIALSGELGAGKTCLVQGIAKGLGVPEEYWITSPTFTLINEYPGRLILYHIDMYRLSGIQDLYDIGFDACFNDRGVVVVEWAEKIGEILPEDTLFISLEYLDENERKLVIYDSCDRLKEIFNAIKGGL